MASASLSSYVHVFTITYICIYIYIYNLLIYNVCVCACACVCEMFIHLNGLCLLALRYDVDGRVAHRALVRVPQLCFACSRVSGKFVGVRESQNVQVCACVCVLLLARAHP